MKSPTMASSSTTITRPAQRPPATACGGDLAARRRFGLRAGGSSTRNTEPARGAVSTITWPPWSCTMPCTIARPMPEPRPTSLVEKKGSNMRSSMSASMPLPLSATLSSTQRAAGSCARHEAQVQAPADVAQPHAGSARTRRWRRAR